MALSAVFMPGSIAAETPAQPDPSRSRLRLGGALTIGSPTGEFRDHVDLAGGFSGYAVYGAPARPLGLRVDAGLLLYGTETQRRYLVSTGGRVAQETVTTDNTVAHLSVGPQLAATSGRARPYLNAFGGVSYFSTTSQLPRPLRPEFQFGFEFPPHFENPQRLFDPFLTTTHFDDTTLSYGAGAGVLIEVGPRSALDIGVRYVANGRVRFLAEGDLEDSPGGATFQTRNSRADMVEFRVGWTILR